MQKMIKRIFVASPGDTTEERKRVNQVVSEVNDTLSKVSPIRLEVIRWETHAIPTMGRPQEIITRQLQLENVDVFIGIIWRRFGTPTGGKNISGETYESGTQEEFETVYRLWKEHKTPEIMFFRSVKSGSLKKVDASQLSKVNDFFDNFAQDKEHPGLFMEYKSISEFERLIRTALFRYAIEQTPTKSDMMISSDFSPRIQEHGFLNFYLPEWNDERNIAKQKSLASSKSISLLAHSGFSFLAQFGHRHRNIVEGVLAQGGVFKAVLTNPWSQSGFYIALGEYGPEDYAQYSYKKRDGKHYLDCLKIIMDSRWYRVKFQDSLNGYYMLKEKYGDRIQLRFTDFDVPASILLTDSDCYLEPYLPINLHIRYKMGMMTYEVRVSNESVLYEHNKNYFDFIWSMSNNIESYISTIEQSKKQLKKQIIISLED